MPAPPPLRKLKCPSVAAARKELKRSATGCSLSFPDIGLLEDSKDENGRKDGRKVWEGLVDLLAENLQHLQALNVSKNGLRPTIVYKLTSALAQNRFLHNLNLSGSNIGGGGLALLVKGLEKSTTLCKLNLYNNGTLANGRELELQFEFPLLVRRHQSEPSDQCAASRD